MSYEFRLQDPGEGIHEAEIIEVNVSSGDQVNEGDDVIVAETDKAAIDIPVPVSGTIGEIRVSEGDVVEVGDVLMVIDESEGNAAASAKDDDATADDTKEVEEEGAVADETEEKGKAAGKAKTSSAQDENVEKSSTEEEDDGTGERSETTNKDDADERSGQSANRETDVVATPAARGLARELGIDLEAVEGSGKSGRVLEADIRDAAGETAAEKDETEHQQDEEDGERRKLRSVRRVTAQRMKKAWREIPHVVHHDEANIGKIERLRRDHAEEAETAGGKLTITPFILKALAGAIGEFPTFNARFDAQQEEIVIRNEINIGVALDTERGLLVPVIRNVDRKSVINLAVELTELSKQLRRERPKGDILKDGTFTLTNVGSIGGTGFSPIINPPQVAIFGAARARLAQVPIGTPDDFHSEIQVLLPVCVAFDHRVIDGAEAARFVNTVKNLLGDPAELLLHG